MSSNPDPHQSVIGLEGDRYEIQLHVYERPLTGA